MADQSKNNLRAALKTSNTGRFWNPFRKKFITFSFYCCCRTVLPIQRTSRCRNTLKKVKNKNALSPPHHMFLHKARQLHLLLQHRQQNLQAPITDGGAPAGPPPPEADGKLKSWTTSPVPKPPELTEWKQKHPLEPLGVLLQQTSTPAQKVCPRAGHSWMALSFWFLRET